MIPNPTQYLLDYIQKNYPGLTADAARIVGIGSSAHIDIWLNKFSPAPRIRLMLPHTAPIEARPLLAEVSFGKESVWHHHEDPDFHHGTRVHLHETAGMFFMLYVKPDIDREWLQKIRPVQDLWREEPILSYDAELFARVTVAQRLGYYVELNKPERQKVLSMQRKYTAS